jgi:hypothetical protein
MRPSSSNTESLSPTVYKPIVYQEITLSELQQSN